MFHKTKSFFSVVLNFLCYKLAHKQNFMLSSPANFPFRKGSSPIYQMTLTAAGRYYTMNIDLFVAYSKQGCSVMCFQ